MNQPYCTEITMSIYIKKENLDCIQCGIKIINKISTAKYCSNNCRKMFLQEQFKQQNPDHGLNTGKMGAVSELIACADLLKNGFDVFRAVSPSCSCDLIIFNNNKVIRVEVTTGYKTRLGNNQHPKKDFSKFDLLAVVLKSGEVVYTPTLDQIKFQT